MKQQRDFVALGVAVLHPEAAVRQMLHSADHVIAELFIKWRFKLMDLFRQPGETAAVNACHHEDCR